MTYNPVSTERERGHHSIGQRAKLRNVICLALKINLVEVRTLVKKDVLDAGSSSGSILPFKPVSRVTPNGKIGVCRELSRRDIFLLYLFGNSSQRLARRDATHN